MGQNIWTAFHAGQTKYRFVKEASHGTTLACEGNGSRFFSRFGDCFLFCFRMVSFLMGPPFLCSCTCRFVLSGSGAGRPGPLHGQTRVQTDSVTIVPVLL